jgi:hypothetical protein
MHAQPHHPAHKRKRTKKTKFEPPIDNRKYVSISMITQTTNTAKFSITIDREESIHSPAMQI